MTEHCLMARKRGTREEFVPAPTTIGWGEQKCRAQADVLNRMADGFDWTIGVRQTTSWTPEQPKDKAEVDDRQMDLPITIIGNPEVNA